MTVPEVRPVRMAHIVIRTNRVAELVQWYKTVFLAEAAFDNGDLAFLYFDEEHHRIAIGRVPELRDPDHLAAGFDHVAFSYGSIGDLLETYDRLKALGIEPFWKIDHGPTTSLYYHDPDGNQVELQVDNFASREETHGYFSSAAFAANPIGKPFDPDALLRRHRAGEAAGNLLSSGTRESV